MNRSLIKRRAMSTSCTSKVNDVKCRAVDEKNKVPVSIVNGSTMKLDVHKSGKSNNKLVCKEKRSQSPSSKCLSTSSTSSTSSSCTSSVSSYSSSSTSSYASCKSKSVASRVVRSIHQPSNQSVNHSIRDVSEGEVRRRSSLPVSTMKESVKSKKLNEMRKSSAMGSKCTESVTIAKVTPLPVRLESKSQDAVEKEYDVCTRMSIITSSEASPPPPPPPPPSPNSWSASSSCASFSSPLPAPPPPAPVSPVRSESNGNSVTTGAFTLDHCTRIANKKVILLPRGEEERDASVTLQEREHKEEEEEAEAHEERIKERRDERKEPLTSYSTMSTNDGETEKRKLSPCVSPCTRGRVRDSDAALAHCIASIVTRFNDSEDKHLHSNFHLSPSNHLKLHNHRRSVQCVDKVHVSLADIDSQDKCTVNGGGDDNLQFESAFIVPPCLRLMIESYKFHALTNDSTNERTNQQEHSSSSDGGHVKVNQCKSDTLKRQLCHTPHVHPQSIKYQGQYFTSHANVTSSSGINWSYGSCINESVANAQEDEASTREIKDLQSQVKCSKEKVSDLTSQLFANAQMMSAFEKTLSTLSMKLQQLTLVNHQKDMEISRLRAVTDVMIAYKAEQDKCRGGKRSHCTDERDNCGQVNSINSLPSSPSKRLWIKSTLNKAFLKNKITHSPSKKPVPPSDTTVNSSSSSTLSRASSSSSSSLSCGWTVDSTAKENKAIPSQTNAPESVNTMPVESESDSLTISDLRDKLSKADGVLEKTRLEAITSAFHLENTKELVNTMREEAMHLRQVNSQLELSVKKKQWSLLHGQHHRQHHSVASEKGSCHSHRLLLC